jgi:glycosyltransferase involved in cell wall biosynthesis
MARTMKILMLSPHDHLRGPLPKHTPVLVAALRERGCEVLREPWGKAADDEALRGKLPRLVRDIRRVRRRLGDDGVDVMVIKTSHEWASLLRDLPLVMAVRRRVRYIVLQFHGGRSDILIGPGNRAFKAASWLLLRLTDGLLLLSCEEANETRTFYPRGSYHTVANPYTRNGHDDGGAERRSKEPTLLFAARIVREKGIFDLVEAVARLRPRLPVRLLVAGGGPAQAELEARVHALGLEREVTLLGHLAHEEMADAYRSSDVFVLPTYWIEGFPTAISEAMDAGLPIVTTRIRGMADHLQEGLNALFVPDRNPAALAATLEELLKDDAQRARMGEANRRKVADFAPERVAAEYIRALEAVMASTSERAE